ncbi:hypothetical protein CAP35_02115 [Chitinophagaceae bacterium IBVUCB1]|nr:hypothetical protein CAP35_02115 [Chitinophagaceae bacterium IBVUCB1]
MQTVFNFTKSALEALPFTDTQYEVRDIKTPSLILRVNPGGIKTFMFYRRVQYRNLRIKIGRLKEISIEAARQKAIFLNSQIIAGVNPNQVHKEKRQELTFRELYYKYYREHALINTKTPHDSKATIEFHLMPKIGNWKLSDITRQKMKELHLNQGEARGRIQANKVLNIASAVFNFGIREQYYKGQNPCKDIRRFKTISRDRFLNGEELRLFFEALKEEEQIYQDFFMLCLFIGARKTTMLRMKYVDIDFDLKRWRLSETETKNGDVNIHALPDAAVDILRRRSEQNKLSVSPSLYVFPGDGKEGHLVDPKKSFARIKKRMGVYDFRIHDLRRTLGSYMAIGNTSLQIIGKALNHKSQVSTEIYARLCYDPVLEAVNDATNLIMEKASKQLNSVNATPYLVQVSTAFNLAKF